MPINPFQQYQEAGFGGVNLRAQQRGTGQMGAGSLSGQGHRSQANMQGPTYGELKPTPKASGRMPEGNANIGRPDYGQQKQQQPQRQGRLASFGGMGAGAVKGGGSGMTAGGDIKFDLSIGKTDYRGANMAGARIGASGMGATSTDSNFGDIDNSQTDSSSRTLIQQTGSPKGGDAKATASADTKRTRSRTTSTTTPKFEKSTPAGEKPGTKSTPAAGEKPGTKPGTKSTPATKKDSTRKQTVKSTGGNAARSGDATMGDIGEGFMSGGAKFGSPITQIGRNRKDSDDITRRSTSRSTKTDVRASGSATASADTKTDARKTTPVSKK